MKNMSKELIDRINNLATPVKIMHVCGSHEHTIMENGIRSLLPDDVEIVAGPGCPVCVVPSREIDEALELIDNNKIDVSSIIYSVEPLEKLPEILDNSELRAKGKFIINPQV